MTIPDFREFLRGEFAHAARQAQLADPDFRHTPAVFSMLRLIRKH